MKLQGIYLFQFTGNEATTILQSTGHHLSIAHPLAFATVGGTDLFKLVVIISECFRYDILQPYVTA